MNSLEVLSPFATLPYPIYSITEDTSGNIYAVCLNGDVMVFKDKEKPTPTIFYTSQGQPSSITFDEQNLFFLADTASQCIISQSQNESLKVEINTLVKEYEGATLEGPNTVVYSSYLNTLFFTDSGVFGTTGFENCKGSVFSIDFELNTLKPLAYKCLAYPTGIAVSEQGYIFVSETCKNRILRFVRNSNGSYNYSTFIQLSGRLGPTAIAISRNGMMYVGRFDIVGTGGLISIVSQKGEIQGDIKVDGIPGITGLCITNGEEEEIYVAGKNTILKGRINAK